MAKLVLSGEEPKPKESFTRRLRALELGHPYLPSWFKRRSDLVDTLVPIDHKVEIKSFAHK